MIVYDIETLRGPDEVEGGWENPEGMRFGCAVTYDTEKDHFDFYQTREMEALKDSLTETGQTILSFNGVKFDNSILLGNNYNYLACPWSNTDLLIEVLMARFRIFSHDDYHLGDNISYLVQQYGAKTVFDGSYGLDALCHKTIGKRKTGHGAKVPQMILEAKWSDVWQYNLQDVRLTWELFQFWRKYRYVIDGQDRVIRALNS